MKLTREQIVSINGIRLKTIKRHLIETGIGNSINQMHNRIQPITNDGEINLASDKASDFFGYVTHKMIEIVAWN